MDVKPSYSDYTDDMARDAIDDMGAAIEKLTEYAACDGIVTMTGSSITPKTMRAFAALAETFPGTEIISDYSGMRIVRRKSREDLEAAAVGSWRSDQYYKDLALWRETHPGSE